AAARHVTALFGDYSADAYRFAYSLTGTGQDADDVVQFVFMQAYRELVAGRRIESPRAWLMRGVKHRSLNVLRDRRELPVPAFELGRRESLALSQTVGGGSADGPGRTAGGAGTGAGGVAGSALKGGLVLKLVLAAAAV